MQQDKTSLEWFAFMAGVTARGARKSITEADAAYSALHALRCQGARAMVAYKQQLEEHVWTGYPHTQLIYDIASASAKTPKDAEAIRALRPLFNSLDEDVLHAWVEANADIGPKVGVTGVDEELLKGLAKYHLSLFDRRRREQQLDREHGSRTWADRIQGFSAGVAAAGLVVVVLQATGVL